MFREKTQGSKRISTPSLCNCLVLPQNCCLKCWLDLHSMFSGWGEAIVDCFHELLFVLVFLVLVALKVLVFHIPM